MVRDRRLSMRIADEEWQMLYALAEREGLSASDLVRTWIRRTYEASVSARTRRRPSETRG